MHSALRRAHISRGIFQAMALPTPEITATKDPPAATPAPRAHEPLPLAAEPGRGVAERHELFDTGPLALCARHPIEETQSILLGDDADSASTLAPPRPHQRVRTRVKHATPTKPGEVDAVRFFAARR